jgi:hypothetical protein
MMTEYLQQSYVIRHLNELKPNYCQHFPLVCILLGDQGQQMIQLTGKWNDVANVERDTSDT